MEASTRNSDRASNCSPPCRPLEQCRPQLLPSASGTRPDSADQDVIEWLCDYNRVSSHNRSDDTLKLANINFYLKDTAMTWYNKNEDAFALWDRFKEKFFEVFGLSTQRKRLAEGHLTYRAQGPQENYITYIEDILVLCKLASTTMTEVTRFKRHQRWV